MERGRDLLRKLLAQLDAPLVVGVQAPDRTLDKGDVLVQRDELAQRVRVQRVAKDRGGRAVAGEDARRDHPLRGALRTDLVRSLAKGEGLRLRKEVAQEELVHVLVAVLRGVGGVDKRDEIGRNHARTLVNELVERVLAVGAGLAPEDLARIGRDGRAVPARGLAVGFHGQLLQVRREAVQVLVVRQHGVACGLEEVDVPDVDEAHERDDVLLERGLAEVGVEVVEACQEVLEHLRAKRDDERQANGSVDGVAAADPAPEAKGVRRIDAKLLHELQVGRDRDEVLLDGICNRGVGAVDCALGLQALQQPGASLARVRHRLERRERLGHDDHQRGLRIEALDLLGHVVGVDVRDVAHGDAGVRVRLEGLVHHDRAQVRAADADGDDGLDLLAGDALPLAGAHAVRKRVHAVQHLVHVLHAVLAVDDELAGVGRGAAQRRVQDGAVLGGIDVHAAEHGGAALLKVHGLAKGGQQLDGLVRHEVLRQVKVQVGQVKR